MIGERAADLIKGERLADEQKKLIRVNSLAKQPEVELRTLRFIYKIKIAMNSVNNNAIRTVMPCTLNSP